MSIVPLYRQDSRHPQAQACSSCAVRSHALFGVLDEDDLDRIHTHIAHVDLPLGKVLFETGEVGSAVFTLREGIVRFERVTESGERRIVRLAGRGDLLGQEALLRRPHLDEAIACSPVQLCRIPTHVVDELGALQPALVRELMQRWQQALEDSQSWLADLTCGSARRRVLKLLTKLADLGDQAGTGSAVWLPKREEIGAMLSMTIETASRQVSQLRREGVITAIGLRSVTLDAPALAQALREEHNR